MEIEIPTEIKALNLFTPITFELTEIIESNRTENYNDKLEEERKEMEQKKQREISKFANKQLPGCSTIGLKNLGNNCYINCILQCLLNNPSFYYHIQEVSQKISENIQEKKLRFSFLEFFRKLTSLCYNKKKLKQISPLSLVKNIELVNSKFERRKQSDAMSFLRGIIEVLCLEISPSSFKKNRIWELFQGEQRRVIRCPKCEYELKVDEKFSNIGILQNFNKNLKEARRNSLKDVKIQGYECDRCESEVTALQKTEVKSCNFFFLKIFFKYHIYLCSM